MTVLKRLEATATRVNVNHRWRLRFRIWNLKSELWNPTTGKSQVTSLA